jgi:hypothetical protein
MTGKVEGRMVNFFSSLRLLEELTEKKTGIVTETLVTKQTTEICQ